MSRLSATEALARIKGARLRFLTTGDLARLFGSSPSSASHVLRRLARKGLVSKMKRGLWANRSADPLDPAEAVSHLISPWPGYVSLHTALSRQGVIDEVPSTTYAVTAGRSARYKTPLGTFRFHHLPERLCWGFRWVRSGMGAYPLAEKEKAFLDLAYLSLIPRSGLGPPYLRRKGGFDVSKLRRYARRFQFPKLDRYLKSISRTLS